MTDGRAGNRKERQIMSVLADGQEWTVWGMAKALGKGAWWAGSVYPALARLEAAGRIERRFVGRALYRKVGA